MKRVLYFLCLFIATAPDAGAATRAAAATGTTGYNYNYMYPYMNNQMRTNLNPGVTTSQSTSPIDVVVKTEKMSGERRVVPRRGTSGRSATTPMVFGPTTATTTTSRNTPATQSSTTQRRVVARSGTRTGTMARATRDDNAVQNPGRNTSITYTAPSAKAVSSSRCLADYTDCMNDYCERPESAYNRCYCSSKLAQIDSKYQTEIDTLVKKLLSLQTENRWSDSEMTEYWESVMGTYGDDNAWTALDQALDIDWAATESRVRGQQAFNTGHEYCAQYLQNCYYMASNLRDAYRSEIARDCAAYETSLQRIKNAAESIIEAYND